MRGARTRHRVGGLGARRAAGLEVGLDEHERRADGVVDDLRPGRRGGHRRERVLDARLDLIGRQQVWRRDDAVERDGQEGRGHARDEEPPPPSRRPEAVQWAVRRVDRRVDAAVGLVHLVGRCWEVRRAPGWRGRQRYRRRPEGAAAEVQWWVHGGAARVAVTSLADRCAARPVVPSLAARLTGAWRGARWCARAGCGSPRGTVSSRTAGGPEAAGEHGGHARRRSVRETRGLDARCAPSLPTRGPGRGRISRDPVA